MGQFTFSSITPVISVGKETFHTKAFRSMGLSLVGEMQRTGHGQIFLNLNGVGVMCVSEHVRYGHR